MHVEPELVMESSLRVLSAARGIVDELNAILDTPNGRLLHDEQLRRSAGSITANIREANGRREGAERNQFFRYARGSAEETDEHLRTNFRANRMAATVYWRLHNRLTVIARMLTALIDRSERLQPAPSRPTHHPS
jgi:four helix bundle protein